MPQLQLQLTSCYMVAFIHIAFIVTEYAILQLAIACTHNSTVRTMSTQLHCYRICMHAYIQMAALIQPATAYTGSHRIPAIISYSQLTHCMPTVSYMWEQHGATGYSQPASLTCMHAFTCIYTPLYGNAYMGKINTQCIREYISSSDQLYGYTCMAS